jgi:DNA polymerase bacteriophage-type
VKASKDGIDCTVCGDRIKVYGGLLAENWTQATARDVLASAWLRCDAVGFRPVLSVHDELVFEVPEASAEEDLRRIVRIFEEPVPWAAGLPLRADGKLCSVYGK